MISNELFAKLLGRSVEEVEKLVEDERKEIEKRHKEGRFEVWKNDTMLDAFYTRDEAEKYMRQKISGDYSEYAYFHSEEINKMIPEQYKIKDRQGE